MKKKRIPVVWVRSLMSLYEEAMTGVKVNSKLLEELDIKVRMLGM